PRRLPQTGEGNECNLKSFLLPTAYCLLPSSFFFIVPPHFADAIMRYRSIMRLSRSVFSTSRFSSSPRIKQPLGTRRGELLDAWNIWQTRVASSTGSHQRLDKAGLKPVSLRREQR